MNTSLVAALSCGLLCGAAAAGTLQVRVTDKDGAPVPDVVVVVDARPGVRERHAVVREDRRERHGDDGRRARRRGRLSIWHPDQLQEQPTQHLQVTAAPLKASGQLNFTPRRRKS